MSISINVTPAASGGTFSVGSTSSQNVTLEVTGGIGPPGTDVALAAGTGISIVTVNNTATISSTVEAAANLADLGDVTLGSLSSGQVLAYNGTAWTAASDNALTLSASVGSDLGTAAIGTSGEAARADHVHNLPTFAEIVGVSLGTPVAGQVLAYDGTAWVPTSDNALTLSTSAGSDLGTAAIGTSGEAARADHVHNLPTFAEITNGTATVTGNLTLNASTGSVTLNGGTAGSGSLTLNCEQNTHGVTIQGPPHSAGATYTLTLPTSDGEADQVLATDGNGSLSWADQSAGGGGITWATEPAASNSTGNAGDIAYGSGFFYLHDGTEWRRAALSTFGVAETFRLLAENGDTLLTETGDYFDTSIPATVTITSQPQNATAAGGTASFSVTATVDDSSTLSYQWQEFTGAIWADVTGGTSSTLSLGGLTSGDDGDQYRVQVSSPTAATVTSATATLTVSTVDSWAQYGSDIDGVGTGYLSPVAMSSYAENGSVMVVGETGNDSIRVFVDNGAGWGESISSNFAATMVGGMEGMQYGGHVSISGDGLTLLAGATGGFIAPVSSGAFTLQLLQNNLPGDIQNGTWIRRVSTDSISAYAKISRNGQYVAGQTERSYYGPSGDDYKLGLYEFASGNLTQVANVRVGNSKSAWRVAVSSDGSVAAATYSDGTYPHNGSDYVHNGVDSNGVKAYEFTGTGLAQRGSAIVATSAGDLFGWSMAISDNGNRLAVGAPYGDSGGTDRGYVRVLDWNGSAWVQVGTDITGVNNYDYAGWSVDISSDGSRVVVGLRGADGSGSNSGTTRIYDWSGSAWVQAGGDIDGAASNDYSGSDVAISGDGARVAIGAPNNDDAGTNAGHVRVFEAS